MAVLVIAITMLFLGTVSAAEDTFDANLTVSDNSLDVSELNGGSDIDDVDSDDNTVNVAKENDDVLTSTEDDVLGGDATLEIIDGKDSYTQTDSIKIQLGYYSWASDDSSVDIYLNDDSVASTTYGVIHSSNGYSLSLSNAKIGENTVYCSGAALMGSYTSDSITFTVNNDSGSTDSETGDESGITLTITDVYDKYDGQSSQSHSPYSDNFAFIATSASNSKYSKIVTFKIEGASSSAKIKVGNTEQSISGNTASLEFTTNEVGENTVYVVDGNKKSNEVTVKVVSGANKISYVYTDPEWGIEGQSITITPTAMSSGSSSADGYTSRPISGYVTFYSSSSFTDANRIATVSTDGGSFTVPLVDIDAECDYVRLYYTFAGEYNNKGFITGSSNYLSFLVLDSNPIALTGNGQSGNVESDSENKVTLHVTPKYYMNDGTDSFIEIYVNDNKVGKFAATSTTAVSDYVLDLSDYNGDVDVYVKYVGYNFEDTNGDVYYHAGNESNHLTVHVESASTVKTLKININPTEYPNEVMATVTASELGAYTINIGTTAVNFEITESDAGVKTVSLGKFDVNDNYEAVITSDDDSTLTNSTLFAVTKGTLLLDVAVVGNNTGVNVGEKTITVSAGADDATGKVQFFEDGTQIGVDKNLGESLDISTLSKGTHIITVKYINDNNYDAEDEVVTFVVNAPEMETTVYLELNTTEVRINGKILVIAHVLDKDGNEITTGDVKVYTRSDFYYADPIKTVAAGESFELTVDSNSFSTYSNPYKLYSRYMGQTTDDMIYKESSNTTGTVYYHVSANNIELTSSDLTIYAGQNVDITATVNGAGAITLSINGDNNGTLTKGTPRTFTLTEAGDYEFIADYTMTTSDYYASCVSEKLTVHVLEATQPVVTIELDKNTVSKNDIITITPTVTGGSADKGTVEFYDENDNLLGSIDLNTNTTFKYEVTGDAGSMHSIYAKYIDSNSVFASVNSDKKDYKIKSTLTITLARNDDSVVVIDDTVYFTITFSDSVSDNLELWVNDISLGGEDGSSSTSVTFNSSDVGENVVFIKFLGNDDFEATESNKVTVNVVKALDTTVTIELNPDAVLPNKNMTITPTVKDSEGNVLTTGVVKIYTDAYMNSDPVAVINAGETGNYSDTKNYAGYTGYLYAVYVPADRTYNRSPVSAGAKYTLLYSNKLDLTVNSGSEITVNDGVSFDILATLTGGEDEITLYINDKANSTLSKNTATQMTLPVGDYTIYAKYTRQSGYYDSAVSNTVTVHVVEKVKNEITVTVESVTLPDQAEIKVTATVDGKYTIDVNGTEVNVTVNGGSGSEFVSLAAGDYYANVTGQEDAIITNAVFTVSPEPKIAELIIRDANYPENATIILSGKGNVTITIEYYLESSVEDALMPEIIFDGGVKKSVDAVNGVYTPVTFVVNETGEFTVNAKYKVVSLSTGQLIIDAENTLTYSVTIIPQAKDIILDVEVDEGKDEDDYYSLDWGDAAFEVVTKASEDIDAEIIYKEGGKELGRAKIGEVFEIDPNDLGLGEHTITATLEGNEDYNEASYTFTLNVDKKIIWYELEIDDVTYPDHAIGKFSGDDVDGKYTITINGTDYTVDYAWDEDEDYVFFDIKQLPAGTYTVSSIKYEDMVHYEFGESDVDGQNTLPTFTVKSKETVLNDTVLSVVNGTAPTFSIDLPGASGNLTVEVDGKNYTKELVDGKATVEITDLPAGNYTATVTYTGDETHNPTSVPSSFKVEDKQTPDANKTFDVNVPEGSTNPVFSINLPGATGNFTVTVDGKNYTKELVNGSASITIDDLAPGAHNVTVSYSGDKNYSPMNKTTAITIPTPVLSNNKNVNAIYSANAYYNVLVTANGKAVVGEKVTITFNGKKYQVTTNNEGYATLKLPTNIKVKKYTITAEFKGVKVSNTVTVKHLFNAKNLKVKKPRKVLKIKIKTNKVNGKFLKGKKLKLKIKGKTLTAKINKKGVATFKVKKNIVKKLKVGKTYKYKVTYGKDTVTKKIKIKR